MNRRKIRYLVFACIAVFLVAIAIVLAASPYFSINLNSPGDNANLSTSNPSFNFTVNGSESCYSCDLYLCSEGVLKKYDTSGNLLSQENFSSTISYPNSSHPNGGICPSGYIWVPGDSTYDTDTGFCGGSFCVMKYEAKNVSGVAISQASGTPWVEINQTDAKAECESLGANYRLITNKEWMTIARNIEQVGSNWMSGTVGSGCMYGGHMECNGGTCNVAYEASASDSQGYWNGTTNTHNTAVQHCPFTTDEDRGNETRRTFYLSNGEVIWDLSGNVWEWTDDAITCAAAVCTAAEMPQPTAWQDFTSLTSYGSFSSYDEIKPSDSSYNSNYGTGRIYNDPDAASDGGYIHAFIRGGLWNNGANAGAFALHLNYAPSIANAGIGFRCVFEVS